MEVPLIGEFTTLQRVFLVAGGVALIALVAEAWILVQLIIQNGRILQRFKATERVLEAAAAKRLQGLTTDRGNSSVSPSSISLQPKHGLLIGDVAPDLRLDDLTGVSRSLYDFRGREVLLLFWDPGCDFCKTMLEELKAWESGERPHSLELLVVSRGTITSNAKLGLHAPILLDPGGHASSRYGTAATPSAVRIDADGRIAAPMVRGIRACMMALNNPSASAGNGAINPIRIPVSS